MHCTKTGQHANLLPSCCGTCDNCNLVWLAVEQLGKGSIRLLQCSVLLLNCLIPDTTSLPQHRKHLADASGRSANSSQNNLLWCWTRQYRLTLQVWLLARDILAEPVQRLLVARHCLPQETAKVKQDSTVLYTRKSGIPGAKACSSVLLRLLTASNFSFLSLAEACLRY